MPEPPEIVPGKQIELYRQDGPSFRSIRVTLHDNGDVGLDLQDMGPWSSRRSATVITSAGRSCRRARCRGSRWHC